MRNLWLLITLIVILGSVGLLRKYWEQRRPSFQTELLQIDTARVNLIQIKLAGDGAEILLRRLADRWILNVDNTNSLARTAAVQQLMWGISQLQTKYLAEAQPQRWEVYDLNDSKGIEIKMYVDDVLQESFVLGAYHYNRQTEKSVSYLRLSGQNEVYAIDGALLKRGDLALQKLRDPRVLELSPDAIIQAVTYETTDTSWLFTKAEQAWQINPPQKYDTLALTDMVRRLRSLQGETLAKEFDELKTSETFHHRLYIYTHPPAASPYVLSCYRDSSRAQPFVIHSSQFPGSYWQSDSTGLYARIMLPIRLPNDLADPQ